MSLGELAAGIAHELGNPLAAICGRMELLEKRIHAHQGSREETLKTIATVNLLTERMTSIIRGMRALSRDGTNDPFQRVPIARLIKDVLGFSWDSFKKHGIEVRAGELDERVQISCQETQISQVFVNLLNNAKDAILPLEEKWIKIELLDLGSTVEVAVTDSGKGIPQELHDKIMLPFFTTKPTGKGSGLGLSISRTIIEHHGGKISVDATCSNTRFVVSLPKQVTSSN